MGERGEGRGEGERRWDKRKWERESGWLQADTYQMLSLLGILMTFLFAQKFQLSLEDKCISGFKCFTLLKNCGRTKQKPEICQCSWAIPGVHWEFLGGDVPLGPWKP